MQGRFGCVQICGPYLIDEKLSKNDLESKVENVVQTPAPDGMLEAPDGSVYLTDLEHSAVVRWNATSNKVEPVIADLFPAYDDDGGLLASLAADNSSPTSD